MNALLRHLIFSYVIFYVQLLCVEMKADPVESVTFSWRPSQHLAEWYTPFDLCIINNDTAAPHQSILQRCVELALRDSPTETQRLPMRCTAGNSWPSRSEFCSAEDMPMSHRTNLRASLSPYDDPAAKPLESFFRRLATERGALLLVGDSVMQQFFGAVACELEREQVWKHPSKFHNTDEVQFVKVEGSDFASPVRFVPIYHMVNGRYDRIPHANMYRLKTTLVEWVEQYQSVVLLVNMGLHYVDNPVPSFTPKDYQQQMTMVLGYLNELAASVNSGARRLRVFWRETSAQHFPTPNGYWPGQRYSDTMRLECAPVSDARPEADWRNRIIEKIVASRKLTQIKTIKFYNATLPLHTGHPNGKLKDCTHFCWTPMLYQSIFHDMNALMNAKGT